MFDQFRSLYPTGSLISEFVTVAEGQFVVRALVEVEGVTLSTGLAAAKTVELAEDQAKRRSLQALGIEIPAALPQMPRVTTAESSSSPLQTPGAATPNLEAQLHSLTDPDPEEEDWLSENTLDSAPSKNRAQNLSLSLPELRLEEGEGEIPPLVPEPSATNLGKKTTRARRTAIEATDFSSDIAKTDIELKRLNWTAEQGVSYLQKTYGKRSRRTLTEEELLDFLHYLESLPTPQVED